MTLSAEAQALHDLNYYAEPRNPGILAVLELLKQVDPVLTYDEVVETCGHWGFKISPVNVTYLAYSFRNAGHKLPKRPRATWATHLAKE